MNLEENIYLHANLDLISCFLDIVKEYEFKSALVCDNENITYKELNEKSDIVAQTLIDSGAQIEDIVGIFVDRSIDTIVEIFGILKAGCAYLPLDVQLPEERLCYMLEKCNVKYIINESLCSDLVKNKIIKKRKLNTFAVSENITHQVNINKRKNGNNLSYVMFTSGSEGNPKGVMIEDKSIIRLVKNTNFFDFENEHRILQSGTLSFDASIFDLFGALLNGNTLYLIQRESLLDGYKLKEQIKRENIDAMFLTTPLFHQFVLLDVNIFENLKYLIVGGDVLEVRDAKKIKEAFPNLILCNGYGPTENTTFSTFYIVNNDCIESVPIGKPISYSSAYILDENLNLVEDGTKGQLYVGGYGLSRGYVNDSSLTCEKFIDNPFGAGKLYKTGDAVIRDKSGNILFLGRIDSQVKIRGYRVELSEIQNKINQFDYVMESFVSAEIINEQKEIVSYIVFKNDFTIDNLRDDLRKVLPEYMIPKIIIQLKKLPLNLNGKVDKSKLIEFRKETELFNKAVLNFDVNNEYNSIIHILKKYINYDFSLDTNLYEVGFNSISFIKLFSELKRSYKSITIAELLQCKSVNDILHLLNYKKMGVVFS